jgi:predicted Zn-dependent peptidase
MPSPELHRYTLANGLRVVLAPDRTVPVVGVSVHYDVGFRSEPDNRTGFAHLFEHLMFQGSESLEKLAHFRHVQSSGGTFNGSTHPDYTDYFEVLPSAAMERALFLEADRMRAPRITEENLRNQVDVVKEEIRLNVLNRPYGGFPWIKLPAVLYQTFPNAHNGYGDFTELEQASLDDCASFFDTFYAPGNAVLTVCGDIDISKAEDLVQYHFGDVPSRQVPIRPSFDEPRPTKELYVEEIDQLAPLPALAAGYRMPDPITELDNYLAYVVLSSVLTDGDASRLQQRMVHKDALVTDLGTGCGLFGSPLEARDPDTFTFTAWLTDDVSADRVLSVLDEELERLAVEGPDAEELARVTARWAASVHRDNDRVISRTLVYGVLELLHGKPELAAELPDRVARVSSEDVAAAAKALHPDSRAVLLLKPANGSAATAGPTEFNPAGGAE